MTGVAAAGWHYGDGTSSPEVGGGDGKKQRKKTEKNGDGSGFKMRPERTKKPRMSLLHASATPKRATAATGTLRKLTDGEVSSASTVHRNYKIATHFKIPITPKFM